MKPKNVPSVWSTWSSMTSTSIHALACIRYVFYPHGQSLILIPTLIIISNVPNFIILNKIRGYKTYWMDGITQFPVSCLCWAIFQICRFCWNKIRMEGSGLCPACRSPYQENPADFKPLTAEELAKIKAEKKQKDQAKKQKISENRKHLANVRVVQKNLVFVVGLSTRLADADMLRKPEYFGKFGKIHKVVINHSTTYAGNQNQVSYQVSIVDPPGLTIISGH